MEQNLQDQCEQCSTSCDATDYEDFELAMEEVNTTYGDDLDFRQKDPKGCFFIISSFFGMGQTLTIQLESNYSNSLY